MSHSKVTSTPPGPTPEKQYDRSLILIQFNAQIFWLVFSAFLLAETVLISAMAAIAKDGPDSYVFYGSLIGLLLVIPWWATFKYNHALYVLRVHDAKNLEPGEGNFLTHGKHLIDNGKLPHHPDIRIPWAARKLSPNRSLLFLIIIFAAAFLSIWITHMPWTWRSKATEPKKSEATHAEPAIQPVPASTSTPATVAVPITQVRQVTPTVPVAPVLPPLVAPTQTNENLGQTN